MIHSFGECELDDERFELRRRGRPVKLEPKVFEVLAYLVRHRDRVVTKSELLDTVWAGVNVSESVLPKCVAAARRAAGETRARPLIRTVHGRGYRLVAEVEDRPYTTRDGVSAGAAPTEASSAAYVGRAPLRARLTQALEDALAGRGRLVVLMGEPGIGKTRTAEALLDEARRRAAAVVIGRAHEGDTAPAFWPWVQILRGVAALPAPKGRLGGAITPELIALVPELGGARTRNAPASTAGPGNRPLAGDDARFRLFDGVIRVLQRATEHQPLVLLLDDLQWADAASMRVLALLAAEIGSLALLVVATCRDDEIDRTAPLADLMATLARASACEWIPLAGLGRDETAALVARVLAAEPGPALVDTIHDMTAGNPFFVQEIARLLPAEGDGKAGDLALPRRVRDAIGRRLSRLQPDCRTLLRIASVLGQDFDAKVLAAVADRPAERVLHALGEARAAHLLDAGGDLPTHYAFHHALIRHTLYDELDDAERVHWHGRAAERIEAFAGADLDPHLDAIAHHRFAALAAGDMSAVVEACRRAAVRADRLFAYEQSARWYERALAALASAPLRDEGERVELLLALGGARAAAGERDAAREVFFRAAALARQLGRADLLAHAALGYRGPTEMGSPSDPPTIALLEEALAAIGDAGPVLRARLLARMTGCSPWADTMAARLALSREARVLAEQSGDPSALRDALSARLWASQGPDHVDERLAVGRDLLAFGQREGGLPMTLLAHDAAHGAHLLRGDLAAAERTLTAYRDIAAALKQPAFLFLGMYWHGSLQLARGEIDAAELTFREALARGRSAVPYAHFMFAGQMYPILYLRGLDDDPELDRIFFGEMMALPYAFEPAMQSALAFALWLRGEHTAARDQFERVATRVAAGLERDEHWLTTLDALGRVAILLGDEPRAALLYDLLLPYADLVVVHDLLRAVGEPVASVLGHLCTVLGRFDEGAGHYERGAAKAIAMDARLALIDTRAGYARLLAARGGRGDRGRAANLRAQVADAMTALGVRRNWVVDEMPGAS